MIVMSAIKMFVQELHEGRIPALGSYQSGEVVQDVKRVRPLVALGPTSGRPCPRAITKTRFHESSSVVEDSEWGRKGTGAEEGSVGRVVHCGRNEGHCIVII